jgi:proteasome lid subunit RPN8/RPN11
VSSDWKDVIRAAVRRGRALADAWVNPPAAAPSRDEPGRPPAELKRLERVVLTDEVSRTLFDEYAAHRHSDRGGEEIGWQLLGVREGDTATVLATLPAGVDRDAGAEHVRFNTDAQAVGYRVVWPADKRLTVVGVVHTHPGTLRHPSGGDLRGDREWVGRLRGGDGVFGIGTADGPGGGPTATQPAPNVQCFGGLRFDWYTLAAGENAYRPLPVGLTIGPDLARVVRPIWPAIEAHAGRLDALARQLARVRFEPADTADGPALVAVVRLPTDGHRIRVLMVGGKTVRFFYEAAGEVFHTDLPAGTGPDHGVYLLLAELAARG